MSAGALALVMMVAHPGGAGVPGVPGLPGGGLGVLTGQPSPGARLDPATLDEFIERLRPAEAVLELEAGDTVWVGVSVRLREVPRDEVQAEVRRLQGPAGIAPTEWLERVETEGGRGGAVLRGRLPIRVEHDVPLGTGELQVRVAVSDRLGRPLGEVTLRLALRVVTPRLGATDPPLLRAVFDRHQGLAARALKQLPVMEGKLRFDRVERPATVGGLSPDEEGLVRAFLFSRLRADAAERRLRGATRVESGPVARAAFEMLATLAPPPPAPLRPVDGAPDRRIAAARAEEAIARFARLEWRSAEPLLWRARQTLGLEPPLLAQVLLRLGVLDVLRRSASGVDGVGQALCLRPEVLSGLLPAALARLPEVTKAAARCSHPMAFHSAAAVPVETDSGRGVRVRVLVGPDPAHLLEQGTLALIDEGGAVRTSRETAAERGNLSGFVTTFAERELAGADTVRVRLAARDGVGHSVIETAVLDVRIGTEVEDQSTGLPWWVWAAGGAAVLGLATGVIAGASSGPATPTIGPVGVRF